MMLLFALGCRATPVFEEPVRSDCTVQRDLDQGENSWFGERVFDGEGRVVRERLEYVEFDYVYELVVAFDAGCEVSRESTTVQPDFLQTYSVTSDCGGGLEPVEQSTVQGFENANFSNTFRTNTVWDRVLNEAGQTEAYERTDSYPDLPAFNTTSWGERSYDERSRLVLATDSDDEGTRLLVQTWDDTFEEVDRVATFEQRSADGQIESGSTRTYDAFARELSVEAWTVNTRTSSTTTWLEERFGDRHEERVQDGVVVRRSIDVDEADPYTELVLRSDGDEVVSADGVDDYVYTEVWDCP